MAAPRDVESDDVDPGLPDDTLPVTVTVGTREVVLVCVESPVVCVESLVAAGDAVGPSEGAGGADVATGGQRFSTWMIQVLFPRKGMKR